MKKSFFIILLILLICTPIVLAENAPKKADTDVLYGQDVELAFTGFGGHSVQIREGSSLKFNIGTMQNTLIIDDIDGYDLKGRLSLLNGPFNPYVIQLGKEDQLNFTSNSFILIKYIQLHPSENPQEQAAILKFHFPFITSLKDTQEKPVLVRITNSSSAIQNSTNSIDTKLIILIVVILVLLILIIFLGVRRRKKKSK